jgi:hypothetical protein
VARLQFLRARVLGIIFLALATYIGFYFAVDHRVFNGPQYAEFYY